MGSPVPDRQALEDLWRQRLKDVKLRLDFARNYMRETRRDFSLGDIPERVELLAYARALGAETSALVEYHRVLGIYTNLVLHGRIPGERDWLDSELRRDGGQASAPPAAPNGPAAD